MIISLVEFAKLHGKVKVRNNGKIGRNILLCRDEDDNEVFINPPCEGSSLSLTLVDFNRAPEDFAAMVEEKRYELAVFVGYRNWEDPNEEEEPTYILIDRERMISKTCVTTVIEKNGRLERKDYPIPSDDFFIGEMNDIVDNPNMSFMDLQNYYLQHFNIRKKKFNCCLPNSYKSFFIDGIEVPSKVSYQEYKNIIKEKKDEIISDFPDFDEHDVERKLSHFKDSIKKEYHLKYANAIRAYNLEKTTSEIKKIDCVKMFSTENIGWTDFIYPINNDVVISVSTNFGYGRDAYLNLTVKYKNIIIIPYSYALKYRYANFYDLISCTRAYIPTRENWDVAFDFVVDYVNKSTDNPEKFVIDTIMHEIEYLMSGLERLMNSTEKEIRNRLELPNNDAEQTTIRVIQPPMEYKTIKRIEEVYPSEFVIIFKAEKVSGSLSFVESFEEIAHYCPVVRQYIIQIEEYNNLIMPKLEGVRNNIERREKTIIQNKKELEIELESIEEKIYPYKTKLEEQQKGKDKETRTAIEWKFKDENPAYRKLLKERKRKKEEKKDKEKLYKLNEFMMDSINNCEGIMGGYFTAL